MPEEWRPIPDYLGRYEASSLGRVRSVDRTVKSRGGERSVTGRVLRHIIDRDGYHRVGVAREEGGVQQLRPVHQLVLEAFVGPRPGDMQARHLDGNPAHNCPGNLIWGTGVENWADRRRHGRGIDGERNPHAIIRARSQTK